MNTELITLNPGLASLNVERSSLFNPNRDPNRTSVKYKESDDLAIVQTLNSLGWFIDKYNQRKARSESKQIYTKYLATYTNPSLPVVKEGKFTLLQTNSKDGTTALIFDLGFFRFACANGLIIGSSLFDKIRLLHKGEGLGKVQDVIGQALNLFPQVAKTIENMQRTVLTLNQAEEFAAKAIELRLGKDSEKVFSPVDVLRLNREADAGNNLWNVLNRVQENLIKAPELRFANVVNKKTGINRKAREVKNIDLNMKINKGIWSLSEEYLNA
jgi:hypothetical protein